MASIPFSLLTILMLGGLFGQDILLSLGMANSLLYAAAIFLCLLARSAAQIFSVPIAAMACLLAGAYFKLYDHTNVDFLYVRLSVILSIWIIALLSLQRLRNEQIQARLAAIVRSSQDAIISKTKNHIVRTWNQAAERIYGYTAAEMIGRPISVICPPDRFHELAEIQDKLRQGESIDQFETIRMRKNGEIINVSLSVSPIKDKIGRFSGYSTVERDITRRMQMEENLRKYRNHLRRVISEQQKKIDRTIKELQEEMASRKHLESEALKMSDRERRRVGRDLHDGQGQILTGSLLLLKSLQNKVSQQAPQLESEVTKIARLVHQAALQSRLVSRAFCPVRPEPTGLMEALQEVTQTLEDIHHIHCEFHCPKPVRLNSHTVATHAYFIVSEAVNNALKHGQASHITIELTNGSSNHAQLTIKDDGIGFDGNRTLSRGMGLKTMQYRADVMGGKLEFRSNDPSGTVVTCLLPTRPASQKRRSAIDREARLPKETIHDSRRR